MTAVSLINPYAPQPATSLSSTIGFAAVQTAQPMSGAQTEGGSGGASDQSGQGAGNGTGTGGAQLASLLERERKSVQVQRATSRSIVEAQAETAPAAEYLERQALRQSEAQAEEDARRIEQSETETEAARAEARRAAMPEFEMPNPLPTAPILKRENADQPPRGAPTQS